MDNRFTRPDEQLDRLAICIDQAGLIALVAQVQANDELAVRQMSAGLCDVLNRGDRPTLER